MKLKCLVSCTGCYTVKNFLYHPVFGNLGLWKIQLFCVYFYGHFSILPFKKRAIVFIKMIILYCLHLPERL